MSKKALIFTIISVIGLCTWKTQAITSITTPITYESRNVPHGYDNLVIHGQLMLGIDPNAIEAGASDDEVYIQFNQNFGNVNITIYNSNNLVIYSNVVNTSIQQVVIIPISSVAAGTYTVVLNKADSYAEGEFEKD